MIKIAEPKVYLIGKQIIDDAELDRFLTDEGVETWTTDTEVAGEKLVEVYGRTCYMSFAKPRPGGNKAYINHVLEVAHGSVTEHAVFSLLLTGVSRALTHELVRHRAGISPSQLSQRFVDESDCRFVVPPILKSEVEAAQKLIVRFGGPPHPTATATLQYLDEHRGVAGMYQPTAAETGGLHWLSMMERSLQEYADLTDYIGTKLTHIEDKTLRRKMAREASRSVLPNATETKIGVTGNARALRHFIEMRGNKAADAEIQQVAGMVLDVLVKEAPNLFGDYTRGPEGIETPYRKV